MNKITKLSIITRLNYIVKKHSLLSRKHFNNEKNIVCEHIFYYIIKKIYSIKINKKIIIMFFVKRDENFRQCVAFAFFRNLRKKT